MNRLIYYTVDEMNYFRACAKAYGITDFSTSVVDSSDRQLPSFCNQMECSQSSREMPLSRKCITPSEPKDFGHII